jgi:hypothetical protein
MNDKTTKQHIPDETKEIFLRNRKDMEEKFSLKKGKMTHCSVKRVNKWKKTSNKKNRNPPIKRTSYQYFSNVVLSD